MSIEKEFRCFFEDFFIPVSRFITHYVREKEVTLDVTQEVFVKVYEKWGQFETQENARAFLYTIARNLSLDYLKHKKAEHNYVRSFLENNDVFQYTFLKEVTRQETFRILYHAIEHLPGQTRQVILLSLEGNSVQEVADKIGVSVNTVKTLKKKAYVVLRDTLSCEYLMLLLCCLGEV